eukprot:721921-Rhodomonas_salina.3
MAASQHPTPTDHSAQRQDPSLHQRVVEIRDKEAVKSPTGGAEGLAVHAEGAYSVVGHLNFEFQVHWERVVARGEMGAAAEAVIQADQTKALTIRVFTDCMTLLQIITQWTLGDFTPSVEAEKHWDILSAL